MKLYFYCVGKAVRVCFTWKEAFHSGTGPETTTGFAPDRSSPMMNLNASRQLE